MKQTKITMNLDGLHSMVEQLGKTYVTKVGILGSTNARDDDDDMGNADIGIIHELGSLSANIEARSFLRMPLDLKKKDLMKVFDTSSMKTAMEVGDFKKAHALLGVKAEEIISEAFSSGGFGQWKDIKEATKKAKGSSAILINERELQRAITSDVVKRNEI